MCVPVSICTTVLWAHRKLSIYHCACTCGLINISVYTGIQPFINTVNFTDSRTVTVTLGVIHLLRMATNFLVFKKPANQLSEEIHNNNVRDRDRDRDRNRDRDRDRDIHIGATSWIPYHFCIYACTYILVDI